MPYQSPKEGYNFFKPLSQTSKDGNKIVPTSGTLPSTNIVVHFEHIICKQYFTEHDRELQNQQKWKCAQNNATYLIIFFKLRNTIPRFENNKKLTQQKPT